MVEVLGDALDEDLESEPVLVPEDEVESAEVVADDPEPLDELDDPPRLSVL